MQLSHSRNDAHAHDSMDIEGHVVFEYRVLVNRMSTDVSSAPDVINLIISPREKLLTWMCIAWRSCLCHVVHTILLLLLLATVQTCPTTSRVCGLHMGKQALPRMLSVSALDSARDARRC